MTDQTDRPIPESLAREIAADAAMLANQVRLMNLVTAVMNPETIFTGGPDGPIREPGDDVPSASDVLTPDETAVAMRTQSAFVAKAGMYGVATDMRLAAEVIESQNMQIERMAKQVALLAAEKRQAQEWIANLRKSNELYSARISFLEGGK